MSIIARQSFWTNDDEAGVDTQADDFRLISHYHLKILGHKKNQKLSVAEEKIINKKKSSKCEKKYKERQGILRKGFKFNISRWLKMKKN